MLGELFSVRRGYSMVSSADVPPMRGLDRVATSAAELRKKGGKG